MNILTCRYLSEQDILWKDQGGYFICSLFFLHWDGINEIMNFSLGMLSLKWLGDIQVNTL